MNRNGRYKDKIYVTGWSHGGFKAPRCSQLEFMCCVREGLCVVRLCVREREFVRVEGKTEETEERRSFLLTLPCPAPAGSLTSSIASISLISLRPSISLIPSVSLTSMTALGRDL